MPSKELTQDNFDQETDRPGVILIDFWASWCGPCQAFAPIFEAASEKYPNILFAKVNTEFEARLAEQFEIRSIPTLLAVKDGEIVAVRVGSLNPQKLEALIREIL